MNSRYIHKLTGLTARGRMRELTPLHQEGQGRVTYKGRSLFNLSSNDYLGLAQDEGLRCQFYGRLDHGLVESSGLAASSSRLLTGDSQVAHHFEDTLAAAYGTEAALLFNSGYHANIGILPTLFGRQDLIISDKLNHASIHDGLGLSRATHKRFRHGDYQQLQEILIRFREDYDQVVIVSESVFSMDGDVADIARLVALKQEYDVKIYLDEAHALGVYGPQGLGKAEELGLLSEIDFVVGTFGKALASVGAFVCCRQEIRDYLVNHSRSLIFTTALPPVILNWTQFVFERMQGMVQERDHLQRLATRLREALLALGIASGGSTNIVPVRIGQDRLALELAISMQKLGYLALPVRPPTVPEGTARFRFSICASMEWQDLSRLPDILGSMSLGSDT